jgi:filamentous hemagglutinin family protein
LSCRVGLLTGICIPALLAGAVPSLAGGPQLFSQPWFTATAGSRNAGSASGSAGGASGVGVSIPAQSLGKVQQSITDLAKAAQAIAAAQAAQNQARAAAQAQPTDVPDGLAVGGLQVAPGVGQGTLAWQGAALPTQAAANGRVGVTVTQTAPQALLNWQTFNVGRHTDLTFDQSAGGANAGTWVALNRVNDPLAQPSQILGTISAQGQVLVMNRNGIIFGAGAQVSVGSLVAASTASYFDPKTNTYAATTQAADTLTLANGFVLGSNATTPSLSNAGGPVTVAPGAEITTFAPATATAHGGSVLLLGTVVSNAGQITTPDGQTILAAGQNFILRQGYVPSTSPTTGQMTASSTTLGTEAAVCLAVTSGCKGGADNGGTAINTGLIQASTGDATLVGHAVTQGGVIVTTTSVTTRGTIHLLTDTSDPTASVTLAPGSVTMIALDTSGATATNAQRAALAAATYQAPAKLLNDEPASASDRLDESRIEITTGGTASFLGDSTTLATGGQIVVNAYHRAFFGTGATLDVAGSLDVTLPASANILTVSLQGYELRDDPTNRDTGSITSHTVYIDERQLVALNGYQYTTGGLAEVSGYVNNQGHTIQEWTTPGGTIAVNSQSVGSDVIAQPGAVFNIAGGSVRYQAGYVPTTWLIGSDGRLYNINTAPSDIVYTGVYDGFTVDHARWGITQTYRDALIAPAEIYQGGYSVGRDGGTLSLNGPGSLSTVSLPATTPADTPVYSVVFEATVDAGVVTGERQNLARTASITDSYLQPQNAVPLPGQLVGDFSGYTTTEPSLATEVRITDSATPVGASIGPDDKLPSDRINTAIFSASGLDAAGLGGLKIATYGTITVDAPLTLATGGQLTLAAPGIAISAPLSARAGSVILGNVYANSTTGFLNPPSGRPQDAGVSLSAAASIDTRGLWTNLATDPLDLASLAAINGGAVTIDTSQSLTLAAGSTIDASSGGAVLGAGSTRGGNGGNITLIAYDPADGALPQAPTAPFSLGTQLVSLGSTQGGALTLKVPLVQIGASAAAPAAGQLTLPASFFASGFSNYDITGYNGVTVTDGTQLQVAEPVFQITAASARAPTGTDPAAAMAVWLPPLFTPNPVTAQLTQRQGASLALHALAAKQGIGDVGGPLTIGSGAAITLDPGQSQSVTLEAFGQITIDGTVTVPGGNIRVSNYAQIFSQGDGLSSLVAPQQYLLTPASTDPRNFAAGMSIWLGPDSRLDVAGVAATAHDSYGRSYGNVQNVNGGTITLGSPPSAGLLTPITTAAYIVARPGSVLDASGAVATIDQDAGVAPVLAGGRLVAQTAPVTAAGAGGSINLDSESGIVLEGALRALSGGVGAPGGSLSIILWTPNFGLYALASLPPPGQASNSPVLVDSQRAPREIIVGQTAMPSGLPSDLAPVDPATPFQPGQARIAVTQIAAGGFDTVSLASDDTITFDGTVSLSVGRTLSLQAANLAETRPDGAVTLSAPYVKLSGVVPSQSSGALGGVFLGELADRQPNSSVNDTTLNYQWQPPVGASTASLLIKASVIDVSGPVASGYSVGANYNDPSTGNLSLDRLGNPVAASGIPSAEARYNTAVSQDEPGLITQYERPGFAQITFASSGDLRFQPDLANAQATLVTSGNLTLSAAQIYPVAGANAKVLAGVTFDLTAANFLQPGGRIVISSPGGPIPPTPLTVGGTLLLAAGEIDQGGVLRAPFGQITLGATGNESNIDTVFASGATQPATFTTLVKLLPGSFTSVSGEGATFPYGGTADGTSYTVCTTAGCADLSSSSPIAPTVSLLGQGIAVAQGARLDLSGGGELAGSAFVFGRGGSYDILQTPLLRLSKTNTLTPPSLATNPVYVYAIVPGQQVAAAPAPQTQTAWKTQTTWNGSPTTVGEQITIGAGVPGLQAGTYTLMPANFALLPGAYRVELATTNHTLLPGAIALGNGSYVVNGIQSIAGTGFQNALPIQVTVSSGAVVRNDAQYNEESYSQYVIAQAALFGAARTAYIPADAGTLAIGLAGGPQPDGSGRIAFSFAGQARLGAAAGGYGGTAEVVVDGTGSPTPGYAGIEVLPASGTPAAGDVGVPAADLNALGAATLSIGGAPRFGANSDIVTFNASSTSLPITLRSGAVLRAPQVFLLTQNGSITVEQGAGINTLGLGFTGLDFGSGVVYQAATGSNPVNLLAVSNGQLVFLPTAGFGSLAIGTCVTPGTCSGTSTLYTDGTIAFASSSASFGTNVTFGASRLNVSVNSVNLGTAGALAVAADTAGGALSGLTLTDTALATLLAGVPSADPSVAIPSLQHLTLTAQQSLNIYGTADPFNPAGTNARLASIELNTPAIYGYGTASDAFTLTAGTLYWNGVAANGSASATPGDPGGKLGAGTLTINASSIVLGYGPEDQANSAIQMNRVVQGFGNVNLIASDRITANNWGTLVVTGNLTLATPLLTGQAGSLNTMTATGALKVLGTGATATAGVGSLGAELHLGGDPSATLPGCTGALPCWPQSIDIETAVGLPGGRLTVNAIGDVTLGAGSTLDLSGRAFTLFGQTSYGWGGDVLIESAKGNVTQAPGGRIDVSAVNADAGSITITATAASGGAVTLGGTLDGASTGSAPGAGGSFGVRAQTLGGSGSLSDAFAAVNAALDPGGFSASRTFDLKQGSLDITGVVKASDVEVSIDNGSLTVAGTIDASGPHPGTIRLSAQNALLIGSGAVLDAHATQAWTDSYGEAIPAENQATIELSAGLGVTAGTTNANPNARLEIDPGARLDVSSPAAAQIGSNQGVVTLNVADRPNGTVNVSVPAGVTVAGAQSVALYGFVTEALNNGTVTQTLLSSLAAVPKTAGDDLSGLLALGSAYLRPGVQIVSSGDLTVSSLIDLSQLRGGPGALALRAAGNLTITNSISDGFTLTQQTVASFTGSIAPTSAEVSGSIAETNGTSTLTVYSKAGTYKLYAGETISGAGVVPGTTITNGGHGVPGTTNRIYTVSIPQTVAKTTIAASGVLLTIPDVASPNVTPGDTISGGKTLPGTKVTGVSSVSTTSSGTSTYWVNESQTVGSSPLSAITTTVVGSTILSGSSWSLRLVAGADTGSADSRAVLAVSALPAATTGNPNPGTLTLGIAGSYQFSGSSAGLFNVIRTGTGNLELLAAGNLQELSPYGVYTAGQQGAVDPAFGATALAGSQDVSYPAGGGNLLVSAQGGISGYIQLDLVGGQLPSDGIGNWLWREGGSGVTGQVGSQPAAWGINFGSEVTPLNLSNYTTNTAAVPQFVGFTGFGALGGGNVTVLAGGNAGAGSNAVSCVSGRCSAGLDVAVASTGSVSAGSPTPTQKGGGDVTIRVGGTINPTGDKNVQQLNGTVTDLRGTVSIRAGAIGQDPSIYQTATQGTGSDPRAISPLEPTGVGPSGIPTGGITVVPGDAMVSIETRRDLVLGAVSDATRLPQQYLSTLATANGSVTGLTWFSLWQPATQVDLFSLGGNVTPTTQGTVQIGTAGLSGYGFYDSVATEGGNVLANNNGASAFTNGLIRAVYPSTLTVVAANGSIAYAGRANVAVELAPSSNGQLALLAADSIEGSNGSNSITFDISGAATDGLPTPTRPAFVQTGSISTGQAATNLSQSGTQGTLTGYGTAFLTAFAFGPDTASGTLHAADGQTALIYAGVDIVNFRTGETLQFEPTLNLRPWYVAGKPVDIRAGNDVVLTGDEPGSAAANAAAQDQLTYGAGDLFLNDTAADVSSIVAGRDIIYANAQILGPGTLEVQAGRNLYQAADGVLESLGVVNRSAGSLSGGAGIVALAGVGAAGPDWARFAALYLDPANQAVSGTAIDADASNGKVAATYQTKLLAYLQGTLGYTGSAADALGFFQALPAAEQEPLLLPIYFAELRLSGREFTDPTSVRAKSYVRGREAIAALFPGTGYQGDITLYGTPAGQTTGGSLIRTDAGGPISILAPGGQLLLGRATDSPNSTNAGVLTQGQGDIGIYTWGNVLLGTSRVFTTFGGGITIWSATGDINAGRSANSVSVFSPVSIGYDPFGNVTIQPQPPAAGGGIATLDPLAGTAPGDVDLIAPLGTIDAGEAGIRVSGNANLSALVLVNTANIQVQGHTSGLPSVTLPNLGALTAASAVSGASSQAAQQVAQSQAGGTAVRQTASVISVEVTGFGGE